LRPFGMCVPSDRAKGETPCRLNRPSLSSAPSATQQQAASPKTAASTLPSASRSSPTVISQPSATTSLPGTSRATSPSPPEGDSHQAGRPGTVPARQHRHYPTSHRNLRATGSSGRARGSRSILTGEDLRPFVLRNIRIFFSITALMSGW